MLPVGAWVTLLRVITKSLWLHGFVANLLVNPDLSIKNAVPDVLILI
jgi:hypothetical protein